MKRRSLFLTIAAGILAWGTGAPEAHAGSMTSLLSTLIADGTEINIGGGLQVLFTDYNSHEGPAANAVTIVWPGLFTGPGGQTNYGFNVEGNFNTIAGGLSSLDSAIGYTVSSISGAAIITNAYVFASAIVNGSGVASVTDTLNIPGRSQVIFGSSVPAALTTPNPNEVDFAPTASIGVVKDISVQSASGYVNLSVISQGYSTTVAVPEPSSMALLGIGLSGLFTLRRLFRRTSVA